MVPRFTIEYHLYEFRTKAGLTDRGLSELSGISKTQINQIEDGKAIPHYAPYASFPLHWTLNQLTCFQSV